MGKSSNNLFTNALIAIVVIGMGMFFWGTFTSPATSNWLKGLGQKNSGQISAYTGKTLYKGWKSDSSPQSSPYKNDYVPQNSYANGDGMEYPAPLVGSVNFVNKKKDAKKKKKERDALAKEKASRSKRDMGLSSSGTSVAGEAYTGGNYGSPSNNQNKKKEKEEENLDTVEYWDVPIFQNQNPDAVTKLIDSYQIKKVSSGVFYEVVGDMTQDERPLIRDYAMIALKATPSSKSFTYLAVLKHTDVDNDIRTEADREVSSYSNASRLGFTVNSIKSTGDNGERIAIEAMKMITKSTELYGSIEGLNQNSDRSTASSAANLQNRWTQAYSSLSTITTQPTTTPTMKAEAEKTMEAISKVMTI